MHFKLMAEKREFEPISQIVEEFIFAQSAYAYMEEPDTVSSSAPHRR